MTEWVPEFILGGGAYQPQQFRYLYGDIQALIGECIAHAADLAVSQHASGASMQVDVAAGSGWVQGDDISRQGLYHVVNDGVISLTVANNTSGSTRTDTVCFYVYDSQANPANGGLNKGQIAIKQGTPGAGAPTLDPTAMPLADLTVVNNATSVTNAQITDRRKTQLSLLRASMPNPMCVLQDLTPPTVSNTTDTTIHFDTAVLDTDGMTDVVSNQDRITIQTPGPYVFTAVVIWGAGNQTWSRRTGIKKSSTTTVAESAGPVPTGSIINNPSHVVSTPPITCAKGDFFTVNLFQDSGANVTILSNSSGTGTARVGHPTFGAHYVGS